MHVQVKHLGLLVAFLVAVAIVGGVIAIHQGFSARDDPSGIEKIVAESAESIIEQLLLTRRLSARALNISERKLDLLISEKLGQPKHIRFSGRPRRQCRAYYFNSNAVEADPVCGEVDLVFDEYGKVL